jgi:hypothetical protein
MSDLDFLSDLLKQPDTSAKTAYVSDAQKYHRESNQKGPLRYWDKEMRCTSIRCGSSTHYKFRGMPLCTVHAMRMMNEELTPNEDE